MNGKYVSILAIVLVLSGGIPLMSGSSINYANAKYGTNTQTQANSNECDSGANCAIPSAQSIGDGTANSPTNLQISNLNEEKGALGDINSIANLRFRMTVLCPQGFDCPRASDFKFEVVRPSSDQGISVKPILFSGPGSNIFFTAAQSVFGQFHISQTIPPNPPGLRLLTEDMRGDGGCGNIDFHGEGDWIGILDREITSCHLIVFYTTDR